MYKLPPFWGHMRQQLRLLSRLDKVLQRLLDDGQELAKSPRTCYEFLSPSDMPLGLFPSFSSDTQRFRQSRVPLRKSTFVIAFRRELLMSRWVGGAPSTRNRLLETSTGTGQSDE